MTTLAIIGATGKAGSLMLDKAVVRGLEVTAIVRDAKKVKQDVPVIEKDVFALTRDDIKAFDAVIVAYKAAEGQEEDYHKLFVHLKDIFTGTDTHLLIMGGAGSLYTDESHSKKHWETMDQNAPWIATPRELAKASEIIKTSDLNWTYFSPADFLNPEGAETGDVTITDNVLRYNSKGESEVSYPDYAAAMIDLVISGDHQREHIGIYGN